MIGASFSFFLKYNTLVIVSIDFHKHCEIVGIGWSKYYYYFIYYSLYITIFRFIKKYNENIWERDRFEEVILNARIGEDFLWLEISKVAAFLR